MLLTAAVRRLVRAAAALASNGLTANGSTAPPSTPLLARQSPTLAAPRRLCAGGGSDGGPCWKCSRRLRRSTSLFCECGVVQSPHPGLSHFALLLGEGQASTYRVDLQQLAGAMRRLQWQLHPDKFAHASDEERALAQKQSARVNEAYRCLTDPVRRAVYLLGLRGVPMPTEETGVGGGGSGDLSLPQEFLAEMLELNEALMEADRTAIGRLSERVDADTAALTEDLARAFDAGDLGLAKELTYRLTYFANIRAKIREMS